MLKKVSELEGAALDWAVAKCEGYEVDHDFTLAGIFMPGWFVQMDSNYWKPFETYTPSTNWAQGGPIIERESINIAKGNPLHFPRGNENGDFYEPLWIAGKQHGRSPLIAAMRCFVASRLGDEIEIPEELVNVTV